MLVIRFFRVGKKNQPSFKIVVTDKKRPTRGGRFLEEVGFYNPLTQEKILKGERIKYWLSVGAKPSATLHNLLVKEKIIEGEKIAVHKKPSKESPEGEQVPYGAGKLPTGQAKKEEPTPEEKPTSEKSVPEEPKEKKAEKTANSDK